MQGYDTASGDHVKPWGILRNVDVAIGVLELPLEHVLVSGSTGFDILVGNDWLRLAQAEISYEKQQISYRIDPDHIGVFSFADEAPNIMVNSAIVTEGTASNVNYLDWDPDQLAQEEEMYPRIGPDAYPLLPQPDALRLEFPNSILPASNLLSEDGGSTNFDSENSSTSN